MAETINILLPQQISSEQLDNTKPVSCNLNEYNVSDVEVYLLIPAVLILL